MNYIAPYRIIADRDAVEAVHEFLTIFIQPDLLIEVEETAHLRNEARSGVASIKRLYAPDDNIVEKNDTITQDHIEALDALAERVAQKEAENPIKRLLQIVSSATIAAFLVFIFGYYVATRERTIFDKPSQLLLLAILAVSTAAIGSIKTNELDVFLVPTPPAAMLRQSCFRLRRDSCFPSRRPFYRSYFWKLYVALICALTAAIAVYTVRHVRHRNQFYR